MLILLAVFTLLLLAGSLFPWNFQSGPDPVSAAWDVLTSWSRSVASSPLHDRLVNLVIYVPIGFTAYLWPGWRSRLARCSLSLLGGFALSFLIETLQHYVPQREPGLSDVVCNTISTLLGILLAMALQSVVEAHEDEWRRRYSIHLSSALLLLGIWTSSCAWPEHGFPLGALWRLRVLMHAAPWAPLEFIDGALRWLLAGCLLTAAAGPRAARWGLFFLLPGLHFLMLVSPGHDITHSRLAGALAAALLFWLLPERHRYASAWLAGLWLAWIVVDGLRPFTFQTPASAFNYMPFRDLVASNWMPSIGVLLRKTVNYGAAYWLFAHTKLSRRTSLSLTLFCLLAIEIAQVWLPGRAGGLTDPAIGLLSASLLWLVDRRFRVPHLPAPLPTPAR